MIISDISSGYSIVVEQVCIAGCFISIVSIGTLILLNSISKVEQVCIAGCSISIMSKYCNSISKVSNKNEQY